MEQIHSTPSWQQANMMPHNEFGRPKEVYLEGKADVLCYLF